ncbi:MAG: ApaG domain-containing protein [Roseibacillus sp.]
MAGSRLGKPCFPISLRLVEGEWQQLEGLSVEVSEVLYVPTLEAPEDKPHPFVYFVNVINDSTEQVTLHGRKWMIREHSGEMTVLEGDGIVGQRPEIAPKDRYSYNSYHVLAGSGAAWGAFYGVTESGTRVMVAIPEFGMAVPGWV